ncbi:MAG: hypothetical protein ABSF25_09355 [Bryobacteraceae bacterium]
MTVDQVFSAFQSSDYDIVPLFDSNASQFAPTVMLTIDCAKLQIRKIPEAPTCFRVNFGFTKETPATLIAVSLSPNPLSSSSSTATFTALRDMLTDKYGPPADGKSEPGAARLPPELVWKFPTSRVKLGLFSLEYSKAPSAESR